MNAMASPNVSLIDVEESVLIVIDVQQAFIDKLPKEEGQSLINRISWLTEVAVALDIPIIVTAEDITECGGTVQQIAEKFPAGTKEHNKLIFGLAGDPEILSSVEQTGRSTTILVGLETDVCVAQSAIGLMEKEHRVVVLSDATSSPGTGHTFGLERMRNAGAVISSVKGLFYEWIRTVDRAKEFEKKFIKEMVIPDGITL